MPNTPRRLNRHASRHTPPKNRGFLSVSKAFSKRAYFFRGDTRASSGPFSRTSANEIRPDCPSCARGDAASVTCVSKVLGVSIPTNLAAMPLLPTAGNASYSTSPLSGPGAASILRATLSPRKSYRSFSAWPSSPCRVATSVCRCDPFRLLQPCWSRHLSHCHDSPTSSIF